MSRYPDCVLPVPVGITHCYALDSGAGLVLVDTGVNTDANWDALAFGLQGYGHRVEDVRRVLLTHSHYDHSGLAARVRDVSGARILIHEADAPFLREGGTWGRQPAHFRRLFREHGVPARLWDWYEAMRERWRSGASQDRRLRERLFDRAMQVRWELLEEDRLPALLGDEALAADDRPEDQESADTDHEAVPAWVQPPLHPDETFADGAVIALGRLRLQAVHTPGHTPGHVCFFMEDPGLLFTGDHVLRKTTPSPGIHFLEDQYDRRTPGLPWLMASLQRVQALAAGRVLPAHEDEPPGLSQAVTRILRLHERRASQVRAAVQAGGSTAFAILPYVYPSLRVISLRAAMTYVISHLDLLEARGQVEGVLQDGTITYHLADMGDKGSIINDTILS